MNLYSETYSRLAVNLLYIGLCITHLIEFKLCMAVIDTSAKVSDIELVKYKINGNVRDKFQ